jgi:hypothetical protein
VETTTEDDDMADHLWITWTLRYDTINRGKLRALRSIVIDAIRHGGGRDLYTSRNDAGELEINALMSEGCFDAIEIAVHAAAKARWGLGRLVAENTFETPYRVEVHGFDRWAY